MSSDLRSVEQPIARFGVSPQQPRADQTVQLFDASSDPRGVGIAWRAWDFGDDVTATGSSPTHRYAHAGAYAIMLTLATFDGRLARAVRVVKVADKSRSRS